MRIHLKRMVAIGFVVGGLLAPAAGIGILILQPSLASAAPINCGTHQNPGSIGPCSVNSYITAYGDPACTGVRYRAYDHYGTSSGTLDQIAFSAYRGWNCGVLYYNLTAQAVYATLLNRWPGWLANTSCGWQADQNTQFKLSGYSDVWRYVNW